jgi:hypothetical protein
MDTEIDVDKVFEALADERYKWRSPKGVADQCGLVEEDVLRVIANNKERIVQSSLPSTDGSPLFTTRKHFLKKSSPFEKIVGAFKGRIG